MYKEFAVEKVTKQCIAWIKSYFAENGPQSKAVIGISGGKDSSIVAALCVQALGKDRVFGVLMPQGEQNDIAYSHLLCKHLGIENVTINIADAVKAIEKQSKLGLQRELSTQSMTNLPARIRMSTLYAVAQTVNGRVANTCNLSENWVGYSTYYGDSVGDFSPLHNLTVNEVKAIGNYLELPRELVDKVPEDGLSMKTDEQNLGFSYAELDKYIREGIIEDKEHQKLIDQLHQKNLFKLKPMPNFDYNV